MSDQQYNPKDYKQGEDRYIRFAEDFLDLTLADTQKRILRAVAKNQRTLIWGANGPGKSFIIAALKLAFLLSNVNSIVLGTSGSYQQYHDTMWRPLDSMHSRAKEKYGLPGKTKGGEKQPVLQVDDEWYAKVVSPRDPGELEGRHGPDVLVVIDEADKKFVSNQHFESAGSSITDLNDKMVAICNPPKDESNVVQQKKEDDRWNVVEISAFEAHNVKVDAGLLNEPRIPGIVDLITIASDWEAWTGDPWPLAEREHPNGWPGMPAIKNQIEEGSLSRDQAVDWLAPGFKIAKEAHIRWDSLPEQWYIRRAGVMPPSGAEAIKPIETKHAKAAWDRAEPENVSASPRAVGIDVARSGDKTVMIGEHNMVLRVHYSQQGANHESQKRDIVEGTKYSSGLLDWPAPQVTVDRGYAPGFADYISDRAPNVRGFQNGTKPVEETRWYDKWAEALYHYGQWLESGGVILDRDLREETVVASRVVEFTEKTLNSRGSNGAEVYEATSKSKIKEELGHSPDYLDAALMTIWRLNVTTGPTETSSTWYDPYQEA